MSTSELPEQSPIFHAQHASRYERQDLIRKYEEQYGCRLAVMIDQILSDCIPLFEDLIYEADPGEDLHLLLDSPGGDGEAAIRLVRQAQSRCNELTVIVPDRAKSAATLLALGAHWIAMGPTSDLGPIDPQLQLPGRELVPARDIIKAVEEAEKKIEEQPNTYPIHAALLENVNALMVQQARSAQSRTDELLEEALSSHTDRSTKDVAKLREALRTPLVEGKSSHSAAFGVKDAKQAGLPVNELTPDQEQWQMLWRLYTKYFTMNKERGPISIYEGRKASQILRLSSD